MPYRLAIPLLTTDGEHPVPLCVGACPRLEITLGTVNTTEPSCAMGSVEGRSNLDPNQTNDSMIHLPVW